MKISDTIIWVVTNPTKESTLQDICFAVTLRDFHIQILGAKQHWSYYNAEYYSKELDAIRDAQKRMDKLKCTIGS